MSVVNEEQESKAGGRVGWMRYVILVLFTFAFTFVMGNTILFNFTVICMDDVIADNQTDHWMQSPAKRNLLFSAVAIGNILGTLPLTELIRLVGLRHVCLAYGLISVLSTGLFPLAVAHCDYAVVFVVRLLQGLAVSMNLPASSAIVATWAPLKNMGMYMSLSSTQWQMCAMLAMPMGAEMCTSSLTWRAAYYVQSAIALVLLLLLWLFYRNDPAKHKMISQKELSKVSLGKEGQSSRGRVPYLDIIKTPVVLGIWCTSIGGSLGYQTFMQFGPIYLNKVLHFEIAATGIATALPYFLACLVKLVIGPLSDRIHFLSDKQKILLFSSASQGFMAAFFVVIALSTNQLLSQIAYTAAIVSSSLNVIGTSRCAQMVSRQFTPFVTSVISVLMNGMVLIMPIVVSTLAPDNTPSQWSVLFFGVVVIIVATNIFFLTVATSEPATWTRTKSTSTVAPTAPPPIALSEKNGQKH